MKIIIKMAFGEWIGSIIAGTFFFGFLILFVWAIFQWIYIFFGGFIERGLKFFKRHADIINRGEKQKP